ncbi:polysaccharide deacetylase family protein [Methylotenera versatilis]|uniref:Polysaccharide deacetylase n=1 Tax=Methylotenera versatilis (strain 301) TaxID=666681 RepID=D7DLZ0_METV0|nr:polysaccharide deacetylase family protein [Methylotenera versatilis]ADI30684.1 polysaccharide deacetylase [Methylotenera versatilis 301]
MKNVLATNTQVRNWQPTLLIKISVILHVVLLAALLAAPQLWHWLLAIFIANQLVISVVGLLPRSNWLGPNWTKLPQAATRRHEIALTIDDGPNPLVTRPVLEILDRYQVKATFFQIGEHAMQHPELCREIIERGHAIENHSQRHKLYFSLMGSNGIMREITDGQETLSRITGIRPKFFRAPAGLRNPFLEPVLSRLGLILVSWSVRAFDTQITDTEKVKKTLISGLKPGAIILLHDGNAARSKTNVPIIIAVLPDLLEAARAKGLHFVTLAEAAA